MIVDEVLPSLATARLPARSEALAFQRLAGSAQASGRSLCLRQARRGAPPAPGEAPISVVKPPSEKRLELSIVVPMEDMTAFLTLESIDGRIIDAAGSGSRGFGLPWGS